MILGAYEREIVSVNKGIPVWLVVLWVVNLSKSVAVTSQVNPCDGHLVTINLDYLPQI